MPIHEYLVVVEIVNLLFIFIWMFRAVEVTRKVILWNALVQSATEVLGVSNKLSGLRWTLHHVMLNSLFLQMDHVFC